jgi:hypothetical protein
MRPERDSLNVCDIEGNFPTYFHRPYSCYQLSWESIALESVPLKWNVGMERHRRHMCYTICARRQEDQSGEAERGYGAPRQMGFGGRFEKEGVNALLYNR